MAPMKRYFSFKKIKKKSSFKKILRRWSLLLRRLFLLLRKSPLTSSFPTQTRNPCITEKNWWITLLRQAFFSTLKLLKKLQGRQIVVVASWLFLFSQQLSFYKNSEMTQKKKEWRDQKNANTDLNFSKYMTVGWGWERIKSLKLWNGAWL